ncbi:MAG: RtcB family protein [Nanoarchaeota archaeon]
MKKHIHNYALNPDAETLDQFKECYEQDFVVEAALMPDAHRGYAAPIGAVLKTKDVIVPAWVGFDIGCGVSSAELKGRSILEKIKNNKESIYAKVKELIPMGKGDIHSSTEPLTKETLDAYNALVEKYEKGTHSKEVLNFLKTSGARHLGTLGDGNHFIELGTYENEAWITIHSGSRGLGFKVAKKYMIKTAGAEENYEATHPLDVATQLGKEYLAILEFGLEFALLNRMEMLRKVTQAISEVLDEDIVFELWVNKNHNHAVPEENFFIHRKGATPAKKGERGVIPGNMRDGCYLVVGKGNKDFLESSSHGAGRVLGRKEAKEKISMESFRESMKDVLGTVTEDTLDEAPSAYKSISAVMEKQKDSVEVVKLLKPLINWKGEGRKKNNQ